MQRSSRIATACAIAILFVTTSLDGQTTASYDFEAAARGFGAVVAVGDGEVIVGEPNNLFRPGMVYVFRKNESGEWATAAELMSSAPSWGDRFGRSIAIDGHTMLISAIHRNGETAGSVVVMRRDTEGNWTAVEELTPADGSPGDAFGASIVLNGDHALIGAANHGDSIGAVYVFRRTDGGWRQTAKLQPSDGAAGDWFGTTIAVSGDHLFVGAPRRDSAAGAVYHFHRDDDGWVERGQLQSQVRSEGSRFGSAIAAWGDRAYIGSPRHDSRAGAVATFRYDESEGRWRDTGGLGPFQRQRRSEFGTSLELSEHGLWVGTPGGRLVYAFSRNDDEWTGVTTITPTNRLNARSFGNAMAVRGDLAVIGVSGSDNGAGNVAIYELVDGEWVAATMLTSPPEGLDPITGNRMNCAEGMAGSWDCNDIDLISFLPVADIGAGRGVGLNDIWGWTDPETGREYALIGRNDGTSFVDTTDPLHPRYLGDLPKTEGSPISVWRDIKVYQNHAFIVSDGALNHGMQVFDLTRLRDIEEPVIFEEDVHYDNIASAHNIVINEATGFAYIVGSSGGGETCGGGLHIVDIRDPQNPTFAGCFADGETGRRGTGYSHDAQCVVYHGPDGDYQGHEICIGSNETGLSFSDVTDKNNPTSIAIVSYPNVAYTHQGWLTDDHRFFYSNDEGDEPRGIVPNTRTLVWDVTDLDDPILVNEYFATTTETDHNLFVLGNYMYQSNYGAGLRILDISDRENPVEVGYFDTAPESLGCCGSWGNYPFFESGVIAVTGGNAGVFFVRKREELVP